MPPCGLSPRIPRKEDHEEQGEARAGEGVRESPCPRAETRRRRAVSRDLTGLLVVLFFRKFLVHICKFFIFFQFGKIQAAKVQIF